MTFLITSQKLGRTIQGILYAVQDVQVADVMYKQGETQFSGVKKKKKQPKSKPDEGSVSGGGSQVQSGWSKIVHFYINKC